MIHYAKIECGHFVLESPPLHLGRVAIKKGAFRSPSTKETNFPILTLNLSVASISLDVCSNSILYNVDMSSLGSKISYKFDSDFKMKYNFFL